MKMIRLCDVAFFADLPALLGISHDYARKLAMPPNGANGEWYRKQRFPDPFHVSPSGIRVWFVRDIEAWASTIRLKRTKRRISHIGSTLLDRSEIADQILGR
jgi:hypothetical protein